MRRPGLAEIRRCGLAPIPRQRCQALRRGRSWIPLQFPSLSKRPRVRQRGEEEPGAGTNKVSARGTPPIIRRVAAWRCAPDESGLVRLMLAIWTTVVLGGIVYFAVIGLSHH